MKLRLATPDDLPRLRAMAGSAASAAQWSEAQWRAIFGTEFPGGTEFPERRVWICEGPAGNAASAPAGQTGDLEAFGFLVAQCSGPDWELENLAVLPALRRRGAGLALLAALLAEGRRRGAERILLEVRASNEGAIRLYERAGFRLLARRRAYYAHPPEDALIYVHSF